MNARWSRAAPGQYSGRIIGVTVIGMLMQVAQHGLTWARDILNNRINNWGVMRLRNELYEKLCGRSDGDSMYRLINDSRGRRSFSTSCLAPSLPPATFP